MWKCFPLCAYTSSTISFVDVHYQKGIERKRSGLHQSLGANKFMLFFIASQHGRCEDILRKTQMIWEMFQTSWFASNLELQTLPASVITRGKWAKERRELQIFTNIPTRKIDWADTMLLCLLSNLLVIPFSASVNQFNLLYIHPS